MSESELQEIVGSVVPQAQPPTLPEEDMKKLTDAVNTLIATVIRIIITHDPDECAKFSKYGRPCETCTSISELRGPAKTIIRLSEKMRRLGGV
jgi:hypothetical protein